MVSQCANPECGAPFLYLREGRLIVVRHKQQHSPEVEFFWLCGDCATYLRYEPTQDGSMRLVPAPSEPVPISLDRF